MTAEKWSVTITEKTDVYDAEPSSVLGRVSVPAASREEAEEDARSFRAVLPSRFSVEARSDAACGGVAS